MIDDEYDLFEEIDDTYDDEEEESSGSHCDDDGEPCDCESAEAIVQGDIVLCPNCRSTDIDLRCGDHGYRCADCNETFTVC